MVLHAPPTAQTVEQEPGEQDLHPRIILLHPISISPPPGQPPYPKRVPSSEGPTDPWDAPSFAWPSCLFASTRRRQVWATPTPGPAGTEAGSSAGAAGPRTRAGSAGVQPVGPPAAQPTVRLGSSQQEQRSMPHLFLALMNCFLLWRLLKPAINPAARYKHPKPDWKTALQVLTAEAC